MCSECGHLVIDIKDFRSNPEEKYEKALQLLNKAYKKPQPFNDEDLSREVSPYRSMRDLQRDSKARVEMLLLELFDEMRRRWLGLSKASDGSNFKLNGKTFIDPKTGKPLSKALWAQIRRDILKAFSFIYEKESDRIVKAAMALGKILHSMAVPSAIRSGLPSIKLTAAKVTSELADPQYFNALAFAEENAAQDIVELSERHYGMIHDTIVEAQKNRLAPRELESKLFDKFGAMNRDWRMISETEIANNVGNGKLLAELQQRKPGEHVFMKGISAAGACDWCRDKVNNRVVLLLDQAPDGGDDNVTVDGHTHIAIWPGKSNVGRSRSDWWVAAAAQHPHCACNFVRHTPGFDKWDKMLDDAMDTASKEWWKEHPVEAQKEQWKRDNARLWNQMQIDEMREKKRKKRTPDRV